MFERINVKFFFAKEFFFKNCPILLILPFLLLAFSTFGTTSKTIKSIPECSNLAVILDLNDNKNACPIDLFIEPVPNICLDPAISTIQLTVTIQGSDGSGFGVWSGPGVIDPVNGVFDPLDPLTLIGDNLITYTFIEGNCIISENTIITVNTPPDPSFNFISPICKNELNNIISIDNNGAQYHWDFDGGIEHSGSDEGPYEISWSVSGSYTVTLIVDNNGCTASEAHSIEVEEPLSAPIVECNTSTSEITFSWNQVPNASDHEVILIDGQPGVESQNTYSVNNLLPGIDSVTIQVTAIGPLPCGNSSSVKTCFTEDCPPLSIITEAVDNICLYPGIPTMQLVSNIENYDLPGIWSGNGIIDPDEGIFNPNHPSVNIGQNKIYVIYTDDVCSYSDTLIINVFDIPDVDAGIASEITCAITDVSLAGSAIGNNLLYNWSGPGVVTGINSLDPTVDHPGTYFLNVTDTLSFCINTDSVVVSADQNVPEADAGIDKAITCDSSSIVLLGNASAGPYFQYIWSGPGINANNMHDQNPEISIPGHYVLQILETQNDCYSPKDSVYVAENTNPPLVDIAQTIDEVNCEILNNELVGNTIPSGEYQWFNSMSQIVGNTNLLTAGNHGVYVYQIKDLSTGCFGFDSILVEENVPYPVSHVLVPESLDCDSREVLVDGSNSFNGPNIVYSWTGPAGGIVDGMETNLATVNLSGNYQLSVLDTLNNCAQQSTGFVLEVFNAPISNISNPDEIDCTLKEIELDGTNSQGVESLNFQWVYNSNIIGNEPLITIGNSGIYSLIVSNESSDCSDTSLVEVVFNAPPIENVSLNISSPSCHGEDDGIIVFDTIVGGSPSYKFSIDGGLNFVSYNQFYYISSGPADLVIEDRNGCQWDTSFLIQDPIKLSLDIGDNQLLYMGDTLELSAAFNIPAEQVDTIIWYPSDILECFEGSQCFEVFGRPLSSIYARATLIDLNGCIVKDKIRIEVDKESIAYVPNIFSPNGDNKNDKFKIYAGNTVKKIKHFSVYNRWGKTIYESANFLPNDPNYGWDGTLNGKPLGPDVFVYWAEVELVNGQKTIFKGEVTLIK